jgi:putative transposase
VAERLLQELNEKLRNELLNGEIFYSLKQAKIVIEKWRKQYIEELPHASLEYRPPAPVTFGQIHRLEPVAAML